MSDELAEGIRKAVSEIASYLSEKDEVRENAIKMSRELIRRSGYAVTYIVAGDLDRAAEELNEARKIKDELMRLVEPHPELLYTGLIYNCTSEYVEAELLYRIVREEPIPGHRELGVPPIPYLQGLGDVVGELRRMCLEKIRRGDYEEAFKYLELMEAVYMELRILDYPDALIPGVRRKADIARRLVEETKALLVDLARRKELLDEMKKLEAKLSK